MTLPTATYRLQFRNGMTFDRAIDLVPHLARLNISHLYCSPIFAAAKGSTHGYDIINPNVIDPDLGGRDGFDRLANALRAANIGLILDIVPNHLSATLDNPWWRSILEWGQDSRFGGYFDVDWSKRLTLPFLSGPLEDMVKDDALTLGFDAEQGALAMLFYDNAYPLHPHTYRTALEGVAHPALEPILSLADAARPDDEDRFHEDMRIRLADATDLNAAVKAAASPERLLTVIEAQRWVPIEWRKAASGLSYRRFFEITGLAGVRVEQEDVFDATHRLALALVETGVIDGLRVDHIDGLADPEAYLARLRDRIGPSAYLVVEKILEHEEQLPSSWPVNGTTGYEFIATLSNLFLPERLDGVDNAYRRLIGDGYEPQAEFLKAKRLMIDVNFEGEVKALEKMAVSIAECEEVASTPDPEAIARAVRDVLAAFPVYRTYGSKDGLRAQDSDVLLKIFERLYRKADLEDAPALRCVQAMLRGEICKDNAELAVAFRTRMQHLTGPLLAKALEDTFFYRYHRLLALNEVGCDPLQTGGSLSHFHSRMKERALRQPTSLSATSTHDTKRGEDARARLFAIAEAPEAWAEGVQRWRAMNKPHLAQLTDGPAPEADVEWMIYQALAGAWRLGEDGASQESLAAFRERFLAYVEKSLREAKLRANWSDADNAYEQAVKAYVEQLLSPEQAAFHADFETALKPYAMAGLINSLTQTLVKLTAPGIPDIYQGSEGLDFSLVDPDNRRAVDYAALSRLESSDSEGWPRTDSDMAAQKFALISAVAAMRKMHPELFGQGQYIPLEAEGSMAEHVVAFARVHKGEALLVAAPRLIYRLISEGQRAEAWQATDLVLPKDLWGMDFIDPIKREPLKIVDGKLPLGDLLDHYPTALGLASPK